MSLISNLNAYSCLKYHKQKSNSVFNTYNSIIIIIVTIANNFL